MFRKKARRGGAGKRKSEAGETLVESMAAIVIIALSSVLFITMFLTSSKIFRQAKEKYNTVYVQIADADTQKNISPDSSSIGPIIVHGEADTSVEVNWYGDKDYVLSYKVK